MNTEIENTIEGYKYLVTMSIIIPDNIRFNDNLANLCICDSRDEAIEFIKHNIEENAEFNKKHNIALEPYNINRLGGVVKWTSPTGEKWMWDYAICPVKYILK